MEYQVIDIFSMLDEIDREEHPEKYKQEKKYFNKDYIEYIQANWKKKALYQNNLFFNILISKLFSGFDAGSTIKPSEALAYFMQLYNSFNYHYTNDKLEIFSYKMEYCNAPNEYHIFIKLKNDYIVEVTPVKDLFNEKFCFPACVINWYSNDGCLLSTEDENFNYMKYKDNEIHFIPEYYVKNIDHYSGYGEAKNDRREYYFFKLLEIDKYCSLRFKDNYFQTFTNYECSLNEMIAYFRTKEEEICRQ